MISINHITNDTSLYCIYCLRRYATVDHHVIPRGHGGEDIPANKAPMCVLCHEHVHSVGPLEQVSDIYDRLVRAQHLGILDKGIDFGSLL